MTSPCIVHIRGTRSAASAGSAEGRKYLWIYADRVWRVDRWGSAAWTPLWTPVVMFVQSEATAGSLRARRSSWRSTVSTCLTEHAALFDNCSTWHIQKPVRAMALAVCCRFPGQSCRICAGRRVAHKSSPPPPTPPSLILHQPSIHISPPATDPYNIIIRQRRWITFKNHSKL